MALCLGLSGCVSGPPNGQVRSRGTITAVNTSDQTIQIKTDKGESLTLSVVETTKLAKKGNHLQPDMTTLDQIKSGKYLDVLCSKSPEGKLIVLEAEMYDDKSGAPYQPPKWLFMFY